jgi:hypothetical protein
MKAGLGFFAAALSSLAASNGEDPSRIIPLTIPSGAPLRLYLTRKTPKRAGLAVEAKLLEPLYSFDREVAPVGAGVLGRVSRLESLSKWQRVRAMMGGDFTPLHRALVEFTTLVMPDGRQVELHTIETSGLNSIYLPSPPKKKKAKAGHQDSGSSGGVLGTGKQTVQDQINAQINSRTRGVADLVRGPNKKERLIDLAMRKLPYHPQWVRRGTRFDAELKDALSFGSETIAGGALDLLGTQPRADSVVHARLITALNSSSARKGQPVAAVLVEPVFAPERKLILPEGTRMAGTVTAARRARWFHRGGQLRFSFQRVDLPEETARLKSAGGIAGTIRTQTTLEAAESGGKTAIKVDSEGGVRTTEPKTRLLAPLISVMIASRAADNDAGRNHAGGADANVSGRTLGGVSGFGLLGAAAAQGSRYIGAALGYYGMAWSVYANVIARGGEVEFDRNAVIDIRFGTRTPPGGSKYKGDAVASRNERRRIPQTSTSGFL